MYADASPIHPGEPSSEPGTGRPPGLGSCSAAVCELAASVGHLADEGILDCGLLAGDRPGADVDALVTALARVEAVLAMRLAAAESADALAFPHAGDAVARHLWSPRRARALSRAGWLANAHPGLAELWLVGAVSLEHVDAVAKGTARMVLADVTALLRILLPAMPSLTPAEVASLCARARALLHPPDSDRPDPALAAHDARSLSFAVCGDSVHLSGSLPRLEGELVISALRATAESLRVAGDGLTGGQRRADALVQLALGRGGSSSLDVTVLLDGQAQTENGYVLSAREASYLACSAQLTAVVVAGQSAPLAVGRTSRRATAAQRRALAIRDGGCVVPGCSIPPSACQTHHIRPWERGGTTDLPNLALLCWAHHRQVDLGRWEIQPPDADAPGTKPQVTIRPRHGWVRAGGRAA